jgi:hypothetical protein
MKNVLEQYFLIGATVLLYQYSFNFDNTVQRWYNTDTAPDPTRSKSGLANKIIHRTMQPKACPYRRPEPACATVPQPPCPPATR